MDIYGIGQSIGALVVCYCKSTNTDIDGLVKEIEANPSIFVSGLCDSMGGNRHIGPSTHNFILDLYRKEV